MPVGHSYNYLIQNTVLPEEQASQKGLPKPVLSGKALNAS